MRFVADKLILFGASGDLSQRMLLPSLCALHADGLVREDLQIFGTARSEMTDESFRAFAAAALERYLREVRKARSRPFPNGLSSRR
jgi:glucose-6-phosphate 1-dehydrogenase